jgi:hypothetical protein
MEMSPEAQRIAIAEACGWEYKEDLFGWPPIPGYDKSICGSGMKRLPDYLNDLNAMHEAWSTLDDAEKFTFRSKLTVVIMKHDDDIWYEGATAAQRAEAFLRTLGKWVE